MPTTSTRSRTEQQTADRVSELSALERGLAPALDSDERSETLARCAGHGC